MLLRSVFSPLDVDNRFVCSRAAEVDCQINVIFLGVSLSNIHVSILLGNYS